MVGLNVQEPETTCDDPNCPFHGTLPLRGQVLEGIVVSNKAERTISVERSYYKFIKKYERYEKRYETRHQRFLWKWKMWF